MKCRHCGSELNLPMIDLGSTPPSNAYLNNQTLMAPEKWYPLRVLVCQQCWLVQTEDFAQVNELFSAEYAYFSGFSSSWLTHCERYVTDIVDRFQLTSANHVVEVAVNDGSLLQYVQNCNIPCTGIEPTSSTACAARAKGIEVVQEFFGACLSRQLASQGKQADLIVANNVLAHVPDINDFVAGIAGLLKPQGVAIFEFPHLLKLIAENQFDTIYHEHFSYLSLTAINHIFSANELRIFDVEEYPIHGGSLRVFAQRCDTGLYPCGASVDKMFRLEEEVGIRNVDYYTGLQHQTDEVKNALLTFLLGAKHQGKTVAAYGAAAKGNTLLNYAGVRPDLISYVVDRNPAKQGNYMPGSRLPIVDESFLQKDKPDYVLILPWNLKGEIMAQLDCIQAWNGQFVVAVPRLEIFS